MNDLNMIQSPTQHEIAEGKLVGFIVNNKFKAIISGPFQVARESALAFNPDVSIKAFHDNIMR